MTRPENYPNFIELSMYLIVLEFETLILLDGMSKGFEDYLRRVPDEKGFMIGSVAKLRESST